MRATNRFGRSATATVLLSRTWTTRGASDEITTTEAQISADRTRYDLDPDDEIILSVGRVSTEKNLELLIQAFALVAPKRPKAKLIIVGDGPAHARLVEQAAAAGLADRSIFTGRVARNHLGAFYVLAKVFAFPSLADTQGLVLNEAALAGVPLLACDRLISDIFIDGKTGLLAGPEENDFAAKLTWLLQHPTEAASMGEAGRQVALRYSASAQAQKLVRLYQQATEHHDHLHASRWTTTPEF